MSRRKQENPQPRKSLVTAETDHIQDTLTCGVCQKDFSLSDIVKFIQHKVHTCNKENCLIFEDGDSDVDTETNKQVVGAKRPSISAPITRRDGDLLSRKDIKRNAAILPRPSSAMEVDTNCVDDENVRCHNLRDMTPPNSEDNGEKDELQERIKSPKTKEEGVSDVSTTNSEPKSYVCSTCRQTFESAWLLVQHVQNLHGIKIYIETANNSSNGNTISHNVNSSPLSSKDQTSPHQATQERASSLQILRVPLVEKQFGPSLNCHSLFSRPSSQDFIGDQFQRLNNHTGLGLSSLDGSQTAFERTTRGPSLSLGFEPQMDFYSQRLRQLAGATSPNSAASPRKLLTPSFTALLSLPPSQPSTPSTTPQPTGQQQQQQQQQSSSSSSTSSKASDQQAPISPKLKSCEFCGKSFRFQSNLIVHRRSHTGEKPFKCHICNHACSQASKLKRHMKTHRNKSPGESVASENNSVESARSTPDSTNGKEEKQTNGDDYHSDGQGGDNEEEDEDEDDEEEEEEEPELEEEDMEEEVEREETDGVMVAEDLTTRGPNSSTPVLMSNAEDAGGGGEEKEKDKEKKESKEECDKPILRHSLLSEVMEKIGLAQIQQYNEAFKQALQESSGKALIKEERQSGMDAGSSASNEGNAEDGHERPNRDGNKSSGHSPVNFSKSLLGAFDQSMNANKRLKSELGEHWRDRESLYAGLWLPTLTSTYRDIYLGMSPGSDTDSSRLKASSESALILASAVGGSLSPRPGTSGTGGGGSTTNNSDSTPTTTPSSLSKTKDHRRNDTCEYCGKVFKNCSNLTVHRRSHTGEKPYKCELCSYACAQSSKLTRHMKTHGRIGKDVYRCRFCEMPFSVPSTLEKHMRKCVVQNSSVVLSERDSDSKEMS